MTFSGGASIGWFNASWPLAKLSLSDGMLSLKILWTTYDLKTEELSRLESFKGWFSAGIRIVHSSRTLDPKVIFWMPTPEKVLVAAKDFGFST